MKFDYKNTTLYLFLAGIFLRIFNVFYIPKFVAPDEQPHYNYINFIFTNHYLPKIVSKTSAESQDWEYYQPPFYYLINLPLQYFGENVGFYLSRCFSVILFVFSFLLFQKVLENLKFSDFRKIIINSLFCLLPTFNFISSTINNDNLLIFFSVLTLYFLTSQRYKNKEIILGLLIGLAFLTKLSAIIILSMAVFYYFFNERKDFAKKSLITILISALISLPFFYRNWVLYHSLTAESLVNEVWKWQSLQEVFDAILRLFFSFWSIAGRVNDIRASLYIFCYPFFAIFLASFFLKRQKNSENTLYKIAFWSLIINFIVVLYAGVMYNQVQGRFLFPSMFFVGYFFVIGLEFLSEKYKVLNKKKLIVSFIVILLLSNVTLYLKFEKFKKNEYKDFPSLINFK